MMMLRLFLIGLLAVSEIPGIKIRVRRVTHFVSTRDLKRTAFINGG